MSRSAIQRQKVRSWQLFLLTIGGALLFWGFLRFQGSHNLTEGYQNLNKGYYEDARESFEKDIAKNADRLEAHVGLGLALLSLDKGLDAEKAYAYIHEVQAEGRTPAQRYVIWSEHNPRLWQRYKGHLLRFDAWMAGERLLRAYRIGASQDRLNDLISDYEVAKGPFRAYVDASESQHATPGEWAGYWTQLDKTISGADRSTDIARAKTHLADSLYISNNTPAHILEALPFIERTLREAPEKMQARAWHLMMLSELVRRASDMPDGRSPLRLLEQSIVVAEELEAKRLQAYEREDGFDGLNHAERIHFLLAIASAAHQLALHDKTQASNLRGLKQQMLDRAGVAITKADNLSEEESAAFKKLYSELSQLS